MRDESTPPQTLKELVAAILEQATLGLTDGLNKIGLRHRARVTLKLATRLAPLLAERDAAAGDMVDALEAAFKTMIESRDSLVPSAFGDHGSVALIRKALAAAHSGAPRPDVLGALEDLLTVQPRPVKIPGTDMDLTVSYTEGDLLKMEKARAVAAQARGGA